jgi:hypothetical protein
MIYNKNHILICLFFISTQRSNFFDKIPSHAVSVGDAILSTSAAFVYKKAMLESINKIILYLKKSNFLNTNKQNYGESHNISWKKKIPLLLSTVLLYKYIPQFITGEKRQKLIKKICKIRYSDLETNREKLIRTTRDSCIPQSQDPHEWVESDIARQNEKILENNLKKMNNRELESFVANLFFKDKNTSGYKMIYYNDENDLKEVRPEDFRPQQVQHALDAFRNSIQFKYLDFCGDYSYICFTKAIIRNIFFPIIQYLECIINFIQSNIQLKKEPKNVGEDILYKSCVQKLQENTIWNSIKALSSICVGFALLNKIIPLIK